MTLTSDIIQENIDIVLNQLNNINPNNEAF